ncbi:MAG: DTW domain-containing protein [Clostridia bacterium]|nr:DTW domain-containing protein [Deltaproteobacteria bacterium]
MTCAICGKSPAVCVCDKSTKHPSRLKVLVLQHPQEQDIELGTARLVTTNLAKAKIAVGLSWRSLDAALGEDVDPTRWAVIFPRKEPAQGTGTRAVDKTGRLVPVKKLQGIVVLDGTWSQAKTLWWRNAWLLKLNRIVLEAQEPSIYGAMRKEPRKEYVSTVEAVIETLVALGEPEAIRTEIRKVFRTMVQRARDVQNALPKKKPARGEAKAFAKRRRAAAAMETDHE